MGGGRGEGVQQIGPGRRDVSFARGFVWFLSQLDLWEPFSLFFFWAGGFGNLKRGHFLKFRVNKTVV